MEIHFNGFGPGFISPEEMERQRQEQEAQIRDMIDKKQCVLCDNAFLVNDQVAICNIKKRCVDGENGQDCEHWKLIEALEFRINN